MPLRLPNFFLVGAPKAGTTSLYSYLGHHPRIYTSPVKEPHFFADEIRRENFDPRVFPGGIVTCWDDYCRLFDQAGDESALGEASVCYLWSPTAPERIAARVPDARILIMLRDPAERAFSQYLHGVSGGVIRWSFREHIERNLGHRTGQFCVHYPFLEFGNYSGQVRRYQERFGSNVWIGFYQDFKLRPLDIYREICRFLKVDDRFRPNMELRYREPQVPRLESVGWLKRSGWWQAAAARTPSRLRPIARRMLARARGTLRMDPADRAYLVDFYREDVRTLADLLGRDLDTWLSPD